MNRIIIPLIALVLVTACDTQEPAPAPAATESPAPAPAAKAEVPSLKGQWRVTDSALDLTVADGTATLSAGCLRRGYTFTQKGNQVTFASAPSGSANCGGQSPSAAQEAAFSALSDANLAIFAKDGRSVTLSGLGGMVSAERR